MVVVSVPGSWVRIVVQSIVFAPFLLTDCLLKMKYQRQFLEQLFYFGDVLDGRIVHRRETSNPMLEQIQYEYRMNEQQCYRKGWLMISSGQDSITTSSSIIRLVVLPQFPQSAYPQSVLNAELNTPDDACFICCSALFYALLCFFHLVYGGFLLDWIRHTLVDGGHYHSNNYGDNEGPSMSSMFLTFLIILLLTFRFGGHRYRTWQTSLLYGYDTLQQEETNHPTAADIAASTTISTANTTNTSDDTDNVIPPMTFAIPLSPTMGYAQVPTTDDHTTLVLMENGQKDDQPKHDASLEIKTTTPTAIAVPAENDTKVDEEQANIESTIIMSLNFAPPRSTWSHFDVFYLKTTKDQRGYEPIPSLEDPHME